MKIYRVKMRVLAKIQGTYEYWMRKVPSYSDIMFNAN